MAFTLPWLANKKKKQQIADLRGHNTEDENKLLDEAERRFQISRSAKRDPGGRDLHEKWREIDNVYRGQQWREAPRPHKSQPVLNYTFSLVESVVSRISDNNPEVLVLPRREATDTPIAEMLKEIHPYLWYVNRMPNKIKEAARIAMKYGTVIFEAIWDKTALDGLGEVKYSVVHPMNFYNDPRAYEIEAMDYCFVVTPRSLEWIARRWPDKGHLVPADTEWVETEHTHSVVDNSEEQSATLKAYWFRDENGNICVMYYAGPIVLEIIGGDYDKTDSPVFKHNQFPFSKFVDYPVDKHFWGLGEVELVMLLQRLINSYEAQIIDNTRLMANAEWVVNKALSGLTEDDAYLFDGRPANVVFTMNGGVDKLRGEAIPAHIPQHQERLIFAMEQLLGVHDVVQGRQPSGVRAASAIIALQESANIRVREKVSNMEQAIHEIASMTNWLVLENYTEPRSFRVTGKKAATTLDVHEALRQRNFQVAVEEGMVSSEITMDDMSVEEETALMENIEFPEFDMVVKIGPSIPYSQALLYEQAKEFYQLGIIDRRAVLEVTGFPNREEILARLDGQQADAGQGERVGERTFGNFPQEVM